ncbi:MAG: hypothetical protein ABH821_06285 [archaeon]
MSEFWSEEITGKSYEKLFELKKELDFVLIGGWAVYLHTKAFKSKDIDIVVGYEQLFKLKENYSLTKNDFLKKYEIKLEHFDVDIYTQNFSELIVPVKVILKEFELIEGIKVVKPEILVILKEQAFLSRKGTIKGKKDALDITLILLHSNFELEKYFKLIKETKKDYVSLIKEVLKTVTDKDIPYLNIKRQEFIKKRKQLIEKL